MKLFAIIIYVFTICHSSPIKERLLIPKDIDPLSMKMVEYINLLNTTWKATQNFKGVPLSYLKTLLGVHPDNYKYRLPIFVHNNIVVPDSFDARQQWPNCTTINQIRDQSQCGSCWAFGAVEAMSDRICIASGGKINVQISAENVMSCCYSCGFGCYGGFPAAAWQYWVDTGIVTGGLYGSHNGCQSYEIPPNQFYNNGTIKGLKIYSIPPCVHVCDNGYKIPYNSDKHFGLSVYGITENVTQIQIEIMKNGPVEASFIIFHDFANYKSGVYKRHSHWPLGIHAIRILGWGSENGIPYWLAANSWGTDWGDSVNECGIEGDINAGIPK